MSDPLPTIREHDLNGTTYTIGELAKEFDITTRAIRFYEDEGLISPVRIGSKRLYRRRDRARLKLILRGKRLGFTLAEIRETFNLYDEAHGEAHQLRYYLSVLEEKRQHLIRQREDLEETLRELDHSYAHCEQLLAQQEQHKVKDHGTAAASRQARPSPAATRMED
ncbi:MerR family transcriptional regulator [Ectothiorhodospira lacustris]|uniref:MerR family transcriptional regulator n=1 Tax=Ectothiorhodospira lacustris TaxID=2899127 RepID=UPI001EE8BB7D|nr:MerR family DNA-binding transcriptional regulator [Ectothiorhodospira lacustris]MCG5501378.1 MerR family DNA-binding transcriptional regulator [Ectothiorhodospira lacustris]MCG5511242.1 MerR family DNA-binding transcriptional regulator [Ectothiorhodospira lacustris]MCG5522942.1 MerR family DNA-binding transcriptional regulator [Ectothiorhodospira lacustris]